MEAVLQVQEKEGAGHSLGVEVTPWAVRLVHTVLHLTQRRFWVGRVYMVIRTVSSIRLFSSVFI